MSTHRIDIIEIGDIFPHPNPEVSRMEMTHVFGWSCCIGKGQFKKGDRAIYIEPDFVVPVDRPEFSFLKKKDEQTQERIRVRRFKGALSQGLLIQVPASLAHLPVGTNVIAELGIQRYEPPLPKSTGGNFVSAPSGLYSPKFDVENYQRYAHLLTRGEEVAVTEKIHGAAGRFVFAQNTSGVFEQFCGSRTNWLADDDRNIWWMAYRQNAAIEQWCKNNPGRILYGEVFGQVQDLKYGAGKNNIYFAAYAILDRHEWLNYDDFVASLKAHYVPSVPLLYRGPFDEQIAYNLAETDSVYPGANHLSEGVVILPVKERYSDEIGRVCLKVVSNRYLES